MFARFLFLLSSLFLFTAHASENTYKIKQVIQAKGLVILAAVNDTAVPAGKIFLVTFPDGEQCSLEVLSSGSGRINLTSKHCDRARQITLNLPVEESLYDEPTPAATPTEKAAPAVKNRSEYVLEREISDYGYLLPAGRLGLGLSLGLATGTSKLYTTTATIQEGKSRRTTAGLELGYGVFDRWSLSAHFDYVPSASTDYTPTVSSESSSGMQDPRFGTNVRLVEQSGTAPFDLLIGLEYAPKTGTSKSATSTTNGNMYSGRDTYAVGMGGVRKTENLEFGLTVVYQGIGSGSYENATTGAVTDTGNYEAVGGMLIMQVRLTENIYLRGGLIGNSISGSENKARATGTISKISSYTSGGGLLGASIVVVPKTVLADLKFSSSRADGVSITSGTTKYSTDQNSGELTASLKIVF